MMDFLLLKVGFYGKQLKSNTKEVNQSKNKYS